MSGAGDLQVQAASQACRAMSRLLTAVAGQAGSAANRYAASSKSQQRKLKEARADLRSARLLATRRAVFAGVPLLGAVFYDPARERADAARRICVELTRKSADLAKRSGSAVKLQSRCLEEVGKLEICAVQLTRLGPVPIHLKSQIKTACSRASTLSVRRDRSRIVDVLAVTGGLLDAIGGWAAHTLDEEKVQNAPAPAAPTERRSRTPQTLRRPAAPAIVRPAAPQPRIFLPIPLSMERSALDKGARIDTSVKTISRVFVTPDTDLQPFSRMLPLAYRPGGAKLKFPPIPARAARHNVWSMFDKETWDRIRHSAYESSGRRCIVCGGTGGFFARQVLGGQGRGNSIDCHEAWTWTVEDPSTGVGLQKLDRLLAVCVDCHMMFHEGFAVSAARDRGLSDEAQQRINERRMAVNGVGEKELALRLEEDRENWQATNGIDNWVVDLAQLSGYMPTGTEPIFRTENEAGVSPENVGGLAFEASDGRIFDKVPAEDIFVREMRRAEIAAEQMRGEGAAHLARRLGRP